MNQTAKIGQVKNLEKKIFEEEKKIENLEKEIEGKESKILGLENKIYTKSGAARFVANGLSKYEAQFLRLGFVKRFAKRKLLYSVTVFTSIVLVWRGIWALADKTPGISNPLISIFVGILILWGTDRITNLSK